MTRPLTVAIIAFTTFALIGCTTVPRSETARAGLHDEAQAALKRMESIDPGLKTFLDKAHAYAVFPSVCKGGIIVGGAYGRGVVYEQVGMIGYSDLTQATIGAQLGGQTFAEIIAFETKEALDRFKLGNFAFSANASAVALKAGASATARYENGVAVFTHPNGGLMFEASVGGQKFSFVSGDAVGDTPRPAP